jgi:hypothetical protein
MSCQFRSLITDLIPLDKWSATTWARLSRAISRFEYSLWSKSTSRLMRITFLS